MGQADAKWNVIVHGLLPVIHERLIRYAGDPARTGSR